MAAPVNNLIARARGLLTKQGPPPPNTPPVSNAAPTGSQSLAGRPCGIGQSADRTGCVPAKDPAPKQTESTKVPVAEVPDKLKEMMSGGWDDQVKDTVSAFLASYNTTDIRGLKVRLGIKTATTTRSAAQIAKLVEDVRQKLAQDGSDKPVSKPDPVPKPELGPKNDLPKNPEKPQQPTRVEPKTEQEWREHPMMKILGDKLNIKDVNHPIVQQSLEHLSRVPPALMKAVVVRGGLRGGVYVGEGGLTDLNDMGKLKGVTPRGWSSESSWDHAGGAYDWANGRLLVGTKGSSSPSVMLHEYGHAIGTILGKDSSPQLRQHHKRLYSKLQPYLQQGGPGRAAGMQELMAEGFADVMMDRKKAVELYDEEFVSWVEGIINIKPEDAELRPGELVF